MTENMLVPLPGSLFRSISLHLEKHFGLAFSPAWLSIVARTFGFYTFIHLSPCFLPIYIAPVDQGQFFSDNATVQFVGPSEIMSVCRPGLIVKRRACMNEVFTKSMARNIYFGGSLFFVLIFLALTFHTIKTIPELDNRAALTEQVKHGKEVWENNNCIGCHTLLGEGAYFAPELGNVYQRYGESREAIKAFIQFRPAEGIPGRRSMPQFNLTDEELDAVVEFLVYSSQINTQNWPPNIQG